MATVQPNNWYYKHTHKGLMHRTRAYYRASAAYSPHFGLQLIAHFTCTQQQLHSITLSALAPFAVNKAWHSVTNTTCMLLIHTDTARYLSVSIKCGRRYFCHSSTEPFYKLMLKQMSNEQSVMCLACGLDLVQLSVYGVI